jgi:pilus assembly protein Flp/PilA
MSAAYDRPGTPQNEEKGGIGMQLVPTRERGQGLVEYGLIIALVAVLAIAGLIIFGPAISSLLSNLGSSV